MFILVSFIRMEYHFQLKNLLIIWLYQLLYINLQKWIIVFKWLIFSICFISLYLNVCII